MKVINIWRALFKPAEMKNVKDPELFLERFTDLDLYGMRRSSPELVLQPKGRCPTGLLTTDKKFHIRYKASV